MLRCIVETLLCDVPRFIIKKKRFGGFFVAHIGFWNRKCIVFFFKFKILNKNQIARTNPVFVRFSTNTFQLNTQSSLCNALFDAFFCLFGKAFKRGLKGVPVNFTEEDLSASCTRQLECKIIILGFWPPQRKMRFSVEICDPTVRFTLKELLTMGRFTLSAIFLRPKSNARRQLRGTFSYQDRCRPHE